MLSSALRLRFAGYSASAARVWKQAASTLAFQPPTTCAFWGQGVAGSALNSKRWHCGIAGVIGKPDRDMVKKMLDVTVHRGDEHMGYEIYGDSCIGLNRLAIVDVEGGNQPLHNYSRHIHVVGNGMIYNKDALFQELKDRGFRFNSGNDMEVIAHLYEDYGPNCVRFLDGMFATVVVDERSGNWMAARDPIGKKPFYYIQEKCASTGKAVFYFCSEAKGLQAAGLDLTRVQEFPPGHYYTPKEGFVRYYFPRDRINHPNPDLVRSLLEQAVVKRLIADVPVATFLSGGLDSSIVTALAAKHKKDLTAITVGREGSPDVKHAREVAAFLGIRHEVISFSIAEMEEALEKIIWHTESYCPSIVTNGITTYIASKAARKLGFKVVLVGEGADEVFSGYKAVRHMKAKELYESTKTLMKNIHRTECLRLDRASMAATLEARVPFLDPAVVDYGTNLPFAAKLKTMDGKIMEKYILREAFVGWLPESVLWREKEPFDQGSGGRGLLDVVEAKVTDADVAEMAAKYPDAGIVSKEYCYYYSIWRKFFGDMGGKQQFALFGDYPVHFEHIKERTSSSSS